VDVLTLLFGGDLDDTPELFTESCKSWSPALFGLVKQSSCLIVLAMFVPSEKWVDEDIMRWLSNPESSGLSGNVSLKIPGGENNIEASLVPTRLLLGVSGAEKLSSWGAQLEARLFRALLLALFDPQLLILGLVQFRVGEKFSLSVVALLLGRFTLPPYPLSWNV
jgi:hypothetical protein